MSDATVECVLSFVEGNWVARDRELVTYGTHDGGLPLEHVVTSWTC